MPEPLSVEISSPVLGELRVVERTHRAAESVARVVYKEAELDELVKEMQHCLLDANVGSEIQRSRLRRLGGRLAEMVLPDGVRDKVAAASGPVEFFLDDVSINIPVELFPHGDTVLVEALPVVRHWFCENAAVSTAGHANKKLQVLIVADPAENLPGAQKEGEEVFRKLRKKREWHPRFLGRAVTCAELSRELPDSNILHLAAHYVSGDADAGSGIVMADGLWMPSPNSHSPELIFANSCRAGMIMGANGGLSLAGRFLQRGSLHVIAPFLPTSDQVARLFAEAFYQALLSGRDVASAMWDARRTVGPASWVYWHFGAQMTNPPEQRKPRGRGIYALALIPIILLAAFLLWKNTAASSRGGKVEAIEASGDPGRNDRVENTTEIPGNNGAAVPSRPALGSKNSGIRVAPNFDGDF